VKNSKKHIAILLLSPQIGNYISHKHRSFEIETGESLEFYCPLCNTSLISDIYTNLAHVIMLDETGVNHDVYFSQVVGEHSTFETDGETVHVAVEDAGKYTYFKIGKNSESIFDNLIDRFFINLHIINQTNLEIHNHENENNTYPTLYVIFSASLYCFCSESRFFRGMEIKQRKNFTY
jgi:hypothetical protein